MALSEPAGVRYYCTYFDANYLVKGLALYRSLMRHAAPCELWVLCLDERTHEILRQLALPGLVPIALADLEAGDDALLAAKANRSRVEYYFTCTSSLVLYVLAQCPQAGAVAYVDADLYFFADPRPVEEELGAGSVLIIGHRFGEALRHLESRGVYNVGYVLFRRDDAGLACVRWWRERCLEWCYDREEEGRFADQKYLDRWEALFPGVVALRHLGGGLAPWNMANYSYAVEGGHVRVDGQPLLFVHFHGLRRAASDIIDPRLIEYHARPGGVLKRAVYSPYIRELWDTQRWLSRSLGHPVSMASVRKPEVDRPARFGVLSRAARAARGRFELMARVARGELWLNWRGRLI